MKINAVHLEGFRGATKRVTVKFDPTKSVTVLFGENGAGKSTVVDAIDFACNQSFGSLDGKSLGGEKKHNHVGSLTNIAKAVPSVDVDADCGKLSARLVKDKIVVTETPVGTGKSLVSVLRRSQVLQLIDATPANRFEALRSFFSTPTWTAAETALRQAHKSRQDLFSQQSTRLEQATSTLQTLWEQQGSPAGGWDRWAANVLATPASGATEIAGRLSEVDAQIAQLLRACATYRDAANQTNEDESAVQVAQANAKKAEAESAGSSLDLVQLLEHAKRYVEGHASDAACPVCEQGIDAQELRNELTKRIANFALLSRANAAIEIRQTAVRNSNATLSSAKKSVVDFAAAVVTTASKLNLSEGWLSILRQLADQLTLTPAEQAVLVEQLRGELQQVRDRVTAAENIKRLRDSVDLLATSISDAKIRATDLEAATRRLGLWLNAIEAARKEVLDAELVSMSAGVSALYARIHPDEGAAQFSFGMKANAVSSLDFDADFLGYKSRPVQAYFSESHLDTLGLCVFLTVAQRKAGKDAVIVLDDVLTSVDATHLDRVMGIVDDVALAVSQVIVATHYRLWRDKYRWGKAPLSQTEVIEFGPWTLNSGIQVQAFQDALAELSSLRVAKSIDRQALASKAGIVLESMLDFLTLKFACSLPRNQRAEYTLGALADGIDKKLSALLKSEYTGPNGAATVSANIKPLIGAATSAQWVRNGVGCHFNALDSIVPDSEVLQFVDAVLELSKAMICGGCRTLATKDKSGSNWQCRCGALKMWPLARPKD